MNQNVLRLHVSVNDFVLLHVLKCINDLVENQQSLVFRKLAVLSLNKLVQTAAVAKLQKDI